MYSPLFAALYQGSMSGKSDLLLVWPCILAHADPRGNVDLHPRVIAALTGLSQDRVDAAIAELEADDPDSRTMDPVYGGKRMVRLDETRRWGWFVVNHLLYRKMASLGAVRAQAAERQARKRNKDTVTVTDSHAPVTHPSRTCHAPVTVVSRKEEEEEKEDEISPLPPSPGGFELEPLAPTVKGPRAKKPKAVPLIPAPGFEEFWASYPKKEGKQEAIAVWNGMTPADRAAATKAAPKYAAAMAGKDRDYIKFPQGWLNARRFEDEVAPAVQAPTPPLTAKEKWQKVSPAEAAEWVRIEAMRAQERLESRAHYREMLPTLPPEKITRLLTVILPETDPEFAAELSAEGYR